MPLTDIFLIFAIVLAMRSSGLGSDVKCETNFGVCQYMGNSCSGVYLVNLCDGPYERKCCVPAFNDDQCVTRGGICQSTSVLCAGGTYVTGLCGGPSSRRCCLSDTVNEDQKCRQKGGKCQHTLYACAGGDYVTGLCGGPASRRCCIETPRCSPSAQRLACELVSSVNVRFIQSQGSSASDTPLDNLKDMCEGRQATRSQNRCNEGCREPGSNRICIHEDVLEYLLDLKNNGRIVVEELSGACDSHGCNHQWGKAVDLSRDGRVTEYISKCLARGGKPKPYAHVLRCQF